jgi:threonine dehydratase
MAALPELSAIREARALLANYFGVTPLLRASLSRTGAEAYLKVETGLPTGSFKVRGALYALAANLERRKIEEVTAASTGNHGAAVAFAAKTLGVKATIFLSEDANPVKRKKIEDLGARIVSKGGADLVEAHALAEEYAQGPATCLLHDGGPDLPAGPGTIGLELLDQLPGMTAVFVPMGDTALIRGIGSAIKQLVPGARVVGVQAEQAPSYVLSWRAGKPVPTDTCDTCADGLATRVPEAENVAALRQVVDEMVLVSEAEILDAVRRLYREENILAEPSGSAATAAWLRSPRAGRSVLMVTGGNISDAVRVQVGI